MKKVLFGLIVLAVVGLIILAGLNQYSNQHVAEVAKTISLENIFVSAVTPKGLALAKVDLANNANFNSIFQFNSSTSYGTIYSRNNKYILNFFYDKVLSKQRAQIYDVSRNKMIVTPEEMYQLSDICTLISDSGLLVTCVTGPENNFQINIRIYQIENNALVFKKEYPNVFQNRLFYFLTEPGISPDNKKAIIHLSAGDNSDNHYYVFDIETGGMKEFNQNEKLVNQNTIGGVSGWSNGKVFFSMLNKIYTFDYINNTDVYLTDGITGMENCAAPRYTYTTQLKYNSYNNNLLVKTTCYEDQQYGSLPIDNFLYQIDLNTLQKTLVYQSTKSTLRPELKNNFYQFELSDDKKYVAMVISFQDQSYAAYYIGTSTTSELSTFSPREICSSSDTYCPNFSFEHLVTKGK